MSQRGHLLVSHADSSEWQGSEGNAVLLNPRPHRFALFSPEIRKGPRGLRRQQRVGNAPPPCETRVRSLRMKKTIEAGQQYVSTGDRTADNCHATATSTKTDSPFTAGLTSYSGGQGGTGMGPQEVDKRLTQGEKEFHPAIPLAKYSIPIYVTLNCNCVSRHNRKDSSPDGAYSTDRSFDVKRHQDRHKPESERQGGALLWFSKRGTGINGAIVPYVWRPINWNSQSYNSYFPHTSSPLTYTLVERRQECCGYACRGHSIMARKGSRVFPHLIPRGHVFEAVKRYGEQTYALETEGEVFQADIRLSVISRRSGLVTTHPPRRCLPKSEFNLTQGPRSGSVPRCQARTGCHAPGPQRTREGTVFSGSRMAVTACSREDVRTCTVSCGKGPASHVKKYIKGGLGAHSARQSAVPHSCHLRTSTPYPLITYQPHEPQSQQCKALIACARNLSARSRLTCFPGRYRPTHRLTPPSEDYRPPPRVQSPVAPRAVPPRSVAMPHDARLRGLGGGAYLSRGNLGESWTTFRSSSPVPYARAEPLHPQTLLLKSDGRDARKPYIEPSNTRFQDQRHMSWVEQKRAMRASTKAATKLGIADSRTSVASRACRSATNHYPVLSARNLCILFLGPRLQTDSNGQCQCLSVDGDQRRVRYGQDQDILLSPVYMAGSSLLPSILLSVASPSASPLSSSYGLSWSFAVFACKSDSLRYISVLFSRLSSPLNGLVPFQLVYCRSILSIPVCPRRTALGLSAPGSKHNTMAPLPVISLLAVDLDVWLSSRQGDARLLLAIAHNEPYADPGFSHQGLRYRSFTRGVRRTEWEPRREARKPSLKSQIRYRWGIEDSRPDEDALRPRIVVIRPQNSGFRAENGGRLMHPTGTAVGIRSPSVIRCVNIAAWSPTGIARRFQWMARQRG
ncbi:hypothetical protein GLOTRDRAFT_93555 [Gloeophyllum trabeum ATCC 11539]|uniref:Uncharacterized protein n=1 Tax=Gloeophyllum trabeum (strain ATCC 11539 / FP-39264 / Madison 617) TaxID=670483 RepID=S7Q645_GLOTA|nr:uncharacterized protein GLOTRDRAFT_93555 [Gloeophyllum trabeum ATCC 11539]EPQ54957.1 hypothetical protein GLOTRDRAFT_93555 [Gloeophyllum trabeum ATCC 11539]